MTRSIEFKANSLTHHQDAIINDPREMTATAAGGDIVFDPFEDNDLPFESVDPHETHNSLKADIQELDGLVTLSGFKPGHEERAAELVSEIENNGIELATQILSTKSREKLNLPLSRIPDNTSQHHPPSLNEVRLLGIAWDYTKNGTIRESLRAAINELEEDQDQVEFLLHILEEAEATNGKFDIEAFVKPEVEKLADDPSFNLDEIKDPVTFIVPEAKHLPYQEDIIEDSSKEVALAADHELLVGTLGKEVVAAAFDPTKIHVTGGNEINEFSHTPMIYFPERSHDTNQEEK